MVDKIDKFVAKTEEKSVDIDDVLKKFSIFGRYHVYMGFLVVLICIYMKYSTMSYILITAPVAYSCEDLENATCSSFNSTHTCTKWIYEDNLSFVAEFNLACQEWKRTLIGTTHSVGYMVGLIFVGPLSDRLGRKNAIILSSVSSAIVAVTRSFSNSYWMYVSLDFLESVLGDTFSPIFMFVVEIVSTEKRVTYMTFNSLGYSIGGMLLALLAWLFPYWRTFIRVIYAPALLFVTYQFLLDESPRWLLAKGRKEEAIAVLKKAAKMNKIQIEEESLQKLEYHKEETINFVQLLKSTFGSRSLIKRFLVCIVWWVTSTFVNYGMTINSVSLQGNKYLNFAIIYFIEVPGLLINICILNVLKRKYTLMLYFFLGAVLCFIQPFVPMHLTWLSITLFMGGKLMSILYFEATYLFTSELFPTYTRNSMHGLCSSIGRIGSIIAPQTPLLMEYWSALPALVFGGTSLFASLVTILVPDTANDNLPDTVKQAEAIGNKRLSEVRADLQGVNNPSYCSCDKLHIDVITQTTCTSL